MLVVCNRIPVNPDHAEAFEERFTQREGLVDQMEGFISFQILRPTAPDQPYVVMTFWQDRAAFEAWTSSDAFQKQHRNSGTLPKDAFLGHPQIEISEVIQQTETESE